MKTQKSLLVPQILVNSGRFQGETVSLLGEIPMFSQTPDPESGFETTGLDGQRGGGHAGGSNVGFCAIMASRATMAPRKLKPIIG